MEKDNFDLDGAICAPISSCVYQAFPDCVYQEKDEYLCESCIKGGIARLRRCLSTIRQERQERLRKEIN